MSRAKAFALALSVVAFALPVTGEERPARVVSMNLCTDQLAMLLAAPGQLISVSYLAHRPRASVMAVEAEKYPANRGLAEEIFLLDPDLVIAGTFTTRATVSMLKRLGIPVVEFAPASSLGDIQERITQMGEALGQEDAAIALNARFELDLEAARSTDERRPSAATYYANSYTSGAGTLAHSVMEAAGLDNIAPSLGISGGGTLPLERLVLEQPELLITGQDQGTPSMGEEVFTHPALIAVQEASGAAPIADREWICGTPFITSAIRRLAAARNTLIEKQ
ncbi:MAG: ABC transporter substrate-binding protein [Pseudomonadota bacterium]